MPTSAHSAGFRLPAAIRLGAVHLRVSTLARSVEFYTDILGLTVAGRDPGRAILSANGVDPLLVLTELPQPKPKPTRVTGLYHFALLFAQRQDLGRALFRLVQARYPLQGASDHLVSHALYLSDPDDHGIELYWDRPQSAWPWQGGEVRMDTLPLDLEDLLAAGRAAEPWQRLPDSTSMGHVHLHVAHMAPTEAFYRQVLGFDLMQRFGGSAIFLAAGGYHHHLGANVWAGVGAPPAPHDVPSLDHWTILLPGQDDLAALVSHLNESAIPHEAAGQGVFLADPSQNRVLIRVG